MPRNAWQQKGVVSVIVTKNSGCNEKIINEMKINRSSEPQTNYSADGPWGSRLQKHSNFIAGLMAANTEPQQPLALDEVEDWVRKAVANVEVIDVHTHLFPPSHGELMEWGVDALLTYHYLGAGCWGAS